MTVRRSVIGWARRIYRRGLKLLPKRASTAIATVVSRVRLKQDLRRPPDPLILPGTGPVTLVDARGVDLDALDRMAERIAAGPDPARRILLIDRPDFLGLRSLGISFEYVPPPTASTPWFAGDERYEAFIDRRLEEIRAAYGVEGPLDRSLRDQV